MEVTRSEVARWSMPRRLLPNNTVATLGPLFELFDAQPVADAAHRLQPHRVRRIALDLAAQPVDLDVDGALADVGFCRRRARGAEWSRRRGRRRSARISCFAVGELQRLAAALQLAACDLEGVGAEDRTARPSVSPQACRAAICC